MAVKTSDDGVVIGLKFDVERLKQTLDQVKSMVQASSENAEKAVKKTDDALEKSRKNAEKWKIEPTTKGIEEAQKELDTAVQNPSRIHAAWKMPATTSLSRSGTQHRWMPCAACWVLP